MQPFIQLPQKRCGLVHPMAIEMDKGMEASRVQGCTNAVACEIGQIDHDTLRTNGFETPDISTYAVTRPVIARYVQRAMGLDLIYSLFAWQHVLMESERTPSFMFFRCYFFHKCLPGFP